MKIPNPKPNSLTKTFVMIISIEYGQKEPKIKDFLIKLILYTVSNTNITVFSKWLNKNVLLKIARSPE